MSQSTNPVDRRSFLASAVVGVAAVFGIGRTVAAEESYRPGKPTAGPGLKRDGDSAKQKESDKAKKKASKEEKDAKKKADKETEAAKKKAGNETSAAKKQSKEADSTKKKAADQSEKAKKEGEETARKAAEPPAKAKSAPK